MMGLTCVLKSTVSDRNRQACTAQRAEISTNTKHRFLGREWGIAGGNRYSLFKVTLFKSYKPDQSFAQKTGGDDRVQRIMIGCTNNMLRRGQTGVLRPEILELLVKVL